MKHTLKVQEDMWNSFRPKFSFQLSDLDSSNNLFEMWLGNKYRYFDNLLFKNSKLNVDANLHKINVVFSYIATKYFIFSCLELVG